jgi:hypothetical protein
LPKSLCGSDIDILVNPKDKGVMVMILGEIALSYNGSLVCAYENEGVVLRFIGHKGDWWGLPVDIFTELQHKSFVFYDSQAVLDRSEKRGVVRVASKFDSDMISFLKEIIANSKSRKDYESKACRCWTDCDPKYKKELVAYFGYEAIARLTLDLTGETRDLRSLSSNLRRNLMKKNILERPFFQMKKIFSNYCYKIKRIFNWPGLIILLDGKYSYELLRDVAPIFEKGLHAKALWIGFDQSVSFLKVLRELARRPSVVFVCKNKNFYTQILAMSSLPRLIEAHPVKFSHEETLRIIQLEEKKLKSSAFWTKLR